MKFLKYTDRGKVEKYVNDREVVTFMTTRNAITMTRYKHGGKTDYINQLLETGYTRAAKTNAGA